MRVRDTYGSYDIVLVTFFPIFVAGGIAFMLARKPRAPELRRVEA
jgi:hypothetical protein